MLPPIVALIGRPNVGKSTIFNRLIGEKFAIVSELPGTTRDRAMIQMELEEHPLLLMDTAGILPARTDEPLSEQINLQLDIAFASAALLLFVIDAKDGLTIADETIARALHRRQKRTGLPVLLLANKVERGDYAEFESIVRRLGFGQPLMLSATQGRGFAALATNIIDHLPAPTEPPVAGEAIKVAILGRPNVGKSTLLNAIIGEERAIVSPIPGTTRDPVNAKLKHAGQTIEIIDTAGIRRRGYYRGSSLTGSDAKAARSIEFWSVLRANKALAQADIAIILLDGERGLADQDQHVAGLLQAARTGAIIAVNKWDARLNAGNDEAMAQWLTMLSSKLPFLNFAPVVFLSAADGTHVSALLDQITTINQNRPSKISSHYIDKIVDDLRNHHPALPPMLSLKQDPGQPNLFTTTKTRGQSIHFSLRRALENTLRAHLGWVGWPIIVQSSSGKHGPN